MPETNEPEKKSAPERNPLPILRPDEDDVLIKITAVERSILNSRSLRSSQVSRLVELTLQAKEIIFAGGVLRMNRDDVYVIALPGQPFASPSCDDPTIPIPKPKTRAEEIQSMKAANLAGHTK